MFLLLPDTIIKSGVPNANSVHIASAGIIGTALALVLSLSIIPAQKAADVFSAAILKLYARDRLNLGVFSLLACTALISLLFATGWTFGAGEGVLLPLQFVIIGISLDSLRVFYIRALDLLVPSTALKLVKRECQRSIIRTKNQINAVVRVYRLAGQATHDMAGHRYFLHSKSSLPKEIVLWTKQLEEFAHKGVARGETQGVSDIVATLGEIAIDYAEARRDSLILTPDFTGGIPIGVSDVSDVTNPLCEAIYNIGRDVSKSGNEPVLQSCFYALGNIAGHAMTLQHTASGHWTVPLAHAPVYYSQMCVECAAEAGLIDPLRAAIQVPQKVFSGIAVGLDSRTAEVTALDVLMKIAMASYVKNSLVGCFESVQMMMRSVHHDLRVRRYHKVLSLMDTVLPKLPNLVALEVMMEKRGARMMQTFPPYDMSFPSAVPMLLAESADQIKPMERERAWIDPYHEFIEVSETIVHHYRQIADLVLFDGALLEKWIIDSLFKCVEVHLHVMDNAEEMARNHIDGVEGRLRWFIHAPTFFFKGSPNFGYHHATEACERLALLGMTLLQRQRIVSTEACIDAIGVMSRRCAAPQNNIRYKEYGFAECLVELEKIALAADVLGQPAVAARCRALFGRPDAISEQDWPEFVDALETRMGQMQSELDEPAQRWRMQESSVEVLREILSAHHAAN